MGRRSSKSASRRGGRSRSRSKGSKSRGCRSPSSSGSSSDSSSWRRERARKLQRQKEEEEERARKREEYRKFMQEFEEWRVKDLEARNHREKEWYSMREAARIEARQKVKEREKEQREKKEKKKAKEKEEERKKKQEKLKKKEKQAREDLERRAKIAEAVAARREGKAPGKHGDAEAELAKLLQQARESDRAEPAESAQEDAQPKHGGALENGIIVLDEDE
eukprot:TRINITY_DN43318_c0_g1_i1.p1 TRINITY_DN43318_c0_g1~~TRINITY_DN43318_c0_g1_i1.p1  ORF type:complete len:221 (+),score=73.71 TRINITY_DN43318_c0_g1_i1:57-719(+)